MSDALRSELLAEMQALQTVDAHSHTNSPEAYAEAAPLSLFTVTSYFDRTIASVTGAATLQLYEGCRSDEERWERLKPVLAKARNVSYWRHHIVSYRRLFDLADDELTDRNWAALNETIRERTAAPDWYRHVTEDVCNLKTQVRNISWYEDWDPRYFTAVLRMEDALELHRAETRQQLEAHLDCAITDLHSAGQALGDLLAEYRGRGASGSSWPMPTSGRCTPIA
jgi:hypothetical protein